MKICLGDEDDPAVRAQVAWIRKNLDPGVFKITCTGFIYNDYYVQFSDERYHTLFLLGCPNDNTRS